MTPTTALLATLAAAVVITGATAKCSNKPTLATVETADDTSSARRKSKRWRKVHRARFVTPLPKARPTEFTSVSANLTPAYRVERAHQEIPARAIGAELMEPVLAEYISIRAFAEMQPDTAWPQMLAVEPAPSWKDTPAGKAVLIGGFLALIAVFSAVPLDGWRRRHA